MPIKKATINRKPHKNDTKWGDKAKYKIRKDWKLDTGRPTKKTPELLEKLKDALMKGCTESEACAYAELDQSTLIDRKNADKDFAKQIDRWKWLYIQAIKFASYDRAMNRRNRDSTDILFKIDKSYSDKVDANVKWELSLVDIAREMQQKRLDKEKWDLPTK